MTMKNKQGIIEQVVTLLNAVIEVDDKSDNTITAIAPQSVEILTIKKCANAIKRLSEHTVRQLVVQGNIPYVRTGIGKRGKILISKTALLNYFGGAA